jgi:hypothetical protein
MTHREEILHLIAQLADEQLSNLLPILLSFQQSQQESHSSESAQAYQDWVSSENDLYDQVFANELATR